MAISFIGANAQNATSTAVTLPTHQAGDLLICFAYRDGSVTPPSVPAGWTTLPIAGPVNTQSAVCAYRIATAAGTGNPNFTNATSSIAAVYRGVDPQIPFGGSGVLWNASSATITIPALTIDRTDGSSVVIAFAGHKSPSATANPAAPTGMTRRAVTTDGTTDTAVMWDLAGATSFTQRTSASGLTAAVNMAVTLELRAAKPTGNLIGNSTLQDIGLGVVPSNQDTIAGTTFQGFSQLGTFEVTGKGYESDGTPYVEFRFQYTNNSGSTQFPNIGFASASYEHQPYVSGQGSVGSIYYRKIAGTAPSVVEVGLTNYNASHGFVNSGYTAISGDSTVWTRYERQGRTQSGTFFQELNFDGQVLTGTTVDWTFRIGAPMYEQNVETASAVDQNGFSADRIWPDITLGSSYARVGNDLRTVSVQQDDTFDALFRSGVSQSAGKWYFETTFAGTISNFDTGVGVVNTDADFASFGSSAAHGSAVFPQNGTVWVGGAAGANGAAVSGINVGTQSANSRYDCAVDIDAKLIWFRVNGGNWNGSGTANPATGVGGISIANIVTDFLNATVNLAGGPESAVVNLGSSAFAGTVPSGYTGWDLTPSLDQSLTPSLFNNGTDTFFGPTLSTGGATQTLTPALVTTTDAFFAPTVSLGSAPSVGDPPAYVASGGIAWATSESINALGPLSAPLPVGWSAGQYAILVCGYGHGTAQTKTLTAPSGWTEIWSEVNDGFLATDMSGLVVYGRMLQAGDTDPQVSISFSTTNTAQISGEVHTFSGVNTSTPYEGATASESTSVTSPYTGAAVTTTGANRLALSFWRFANDSNTGAPDTGWSDLGTDLNAAGTDGTVAGEYIVKSTAGTVTSTRTWSGTTANPVNISLALVPTAAAVTSLTPSLVTTTDAFFAPSVAPGPVTLTAARYIEAADSFPAATVAPGPVTLTPAKYTEGADSFPAPVASASNTLTPAKYTEAADAFPAAVALATYALTPAKYTEAADTFFPVATTVSANLTPALYAETGDNFFAATVAETGKQTLTPALHADADSFAAAALATSYDLTPARYVEAGDSFLAATVTPGPVSLTPNRYIETADSFLAATVAPGPVTLTPALYANPDSFLAATMAASYTAAPATATFTSAFFLPVISASSTLTPARAQNASSFYGIILAETGQQALSPSLYGDGDGFFAATVSEVADQILPPLVASVAVFYAPRLDLTILPARFIEAGDSFYGETASATYILTPAPYTEAADTFLPASLGEVGRQTLAPALAAFTSSFPAASIVRGTITLAPVAVSDGDGFFVPSISRGVVTLAPAVATDGDTFLGGLIVPGGVGLSVVTTFTDGDTVHAPTVQPGSVTLSPPLVDGGDGFYTVIIAGGLRPSLYSDPDSFPAATITQTLSPSLLTSVNTVPVPQVLASNTLSPNKVDEGDIIRQVTATVSYTLTPGLSPDGDTFHVPVSQASYTLISPAIADGDAFPAANVGETGHQSLIVPTISDGDAFRVASVQPGQIQLLTSMVDGASEVFLPLMETGEIHIQPNRYADGDSFPAATILRGTVTLTPARAVDGDSFWGARIDQTVLAQTASNTSSFPPATVLATAATVTSLVSDQDAFYSVAIQLSNTLSPAKVSDGDSFFGPVLSASYQTFASLSSEGDSFHAASVSRGQVDLVAASIPDGDTFPAAFVSRGEVVLVASTATDADQFLTPTVVRGAITLTAPAVSDGDSIPAPVVARGQVTVAPPVVTSQNFFWPNPEVFVGEAGVRPPVVASLNSFPPASVSASKTLQPILVSDADGFYGATVAESGRQTLAPSRVDEGDALPLPSVQRGTITLQPSLHEQLNWFWSPHSLSVGGVVIEPLRVTAGNSFGTATITRGPVTLAPSPIPASDSFFPATVARGGVVISPSSLVDQDAFHGSEVTVGAVTLRPANLNDGDLVHPSTITRGPVALVPEPVEADSAVYAPTVTASASLQPALLVDAESFEGPALTRGAVEIAPPIMASITVFPGATVTAEYSLGVSPLSDADAIYPITLAAFNVLPPERFVDDASFHGGSIDVGEVRIQPERYAEPDGFYSGLVGLIQSHSSDRDTVRGGADPRDGIAGRTSHAALTGAATTSTLTGRSRRPTLGGKPRRTRIN